MGDTESNTEQVFISERALKERIRAVMSEMPTITVRMQSGFEFHIDGPKAAELLAYLRSPVAGPRYLECEDWELMVAPEYIEYWRWYPHGNIDTTLERSVADLEMLGAVGRRAINVMTRDGINTIGDLVKMTERRLSMLPNLGVMAIKEIKRALGNYGLRLSQ